MKQTLPANVLWQPDRLEHDGVRKSDYFILSQKYVHRGLFKVSPEVKNPVDDSKEGQPLNQASSAGMAGKRDRKGARDETKHTSQKTGGSHTAGNLGEPLQCSLLQKEIIRIITTTNCFQKICYQLGMTN